MPWSQRGPSCCSLILLLLVTQCLCGFPLCFQSALELALILSLLSYVDHLILSFLLLSWKENLWLQHRIMILTGGMSTSRSAIVFVVGTLSLTQLLSVNRDVGLRTWKGQWRHLCPCFTLVEWQSFQYPPIFPHCRILGRSQEQGTQWTVCCTTWKKVVSQTVLWPAQPPVNKEHFGSRSTKARSGEQKAGKHA